MLSIQIICIGKLKESYLKDAINEYSKRLSKYCHLDIVEVQDSKIPDKTSIAMEKQIKDEETSRLIAQLKKDTYIICLDLNGKEYTSPEFSERIQKLAVEGNSHITFVIGGTLGLGDEILRLAKEKICFSKMTFPHQFIRVFLLEQLFRGFKIANGETYHR